MAEMMYRAVWPNLDPDEETEVGFRAAVAVIPYSVKRRFGYERPKTDYDLMADEAERTRLDDYTNWDAE